MAADLKRFTISVTPGMEKELETVKKEFYCKSTKKEMFQDLISRGLETLKTKEHIEKI